MKKSLTLILLVISVHGFSQSISMERVKHIKECTVRVVIENDAHSGTGFFISNIGALITCWHVIEPSLVRDPNTHIIIGFKRIFIIRNKDTIEVGIPASIINNEYKNALAYDYCALFPIKPLSGIPFLKLGDFNHINEGQSIYTCGYPLGISQQFISSGIISTKYIEQISLNDKGVTTKLPRIQALLDMTMNKGNSGGAIVKMGETFADDEVIGIADFIISPVGENAEELIKQLNLNAGTVLMGGNDINGILANLLKYVSNTSIGVSGCVPINYPLALPLDTVN